MAVKLHFFGEPFVEKNGAIIPIPFKKAEGVLFYSALEGRVSRETLKFLFWGDKGESQAANNIRNAIYLLRKILPEYLKTDHKYLFLENVELDIDAITSLADPAEPVAPFFFIEPLSGFDSLGAAEFDDWLLLARNSIRKKITEQIRARIEVCYEQELLEERAESLLALLVFEPFDEGAVLELMETYCGMGRAAEAVACYNAYCARVESELSMSPSRRVKDFLKKVVASADTKKNSNHPKELFYCRETEVDSILDGVSRNVNDTLLVFVHGEAGVGKSALVNYIVNSVLFSEMNTFIAQPLPIEEKYSYSAWNGIVSQIESKLEERGITVEPIVASVLSGVFYKFMKKENLSHVTDISLVTEKNPVTIGTILADLVTRLSVNSSESPSTPSSPNPPSTPKKRPVFVLEDMHLFDPQSLKLLGIFLSKIKIPLTVFMTSRPESVSSVTELLHTLKSNTPFDIVHIPLAPFKNDDVVRFCKLSLPKEVIQRKGVEYFIHQSDGMPLLLVEMRRMLMDNPDADCFFGLKGVIMNRMEDISPLQREILSILSVFGRGTSVDDIAFVAKSDVRELIEPVNGLLQKKMACEKRENGQFLIDFLHSNVRECVYDSIPGFKRENLHRQVAEILSRRHSPQIWNPELSSALCHHYTMANMKTQLLKQHLCEMAFHITLNHVLFPLVEDKTLLTCSIPFSNREDTENKIDRVRDLLGDINKDDDNKKMEASYLEIYGGYLINWGEYQKGCFFIDKALKITMEHDLDEIQIHCLEHIGHYCLQIDESDRLLSTGRRILRLAKKMGKENHVGLALRFIGMSKLIAKNFSSAEKVFWRSIDLFEELALMGKHYTPNLLASRCYIGEMRQWLGDVDVAMEHFVYCIKRCLESGLFWGRSHFHAHAADTALDMTDWQLVYHHIDTGVTLFESSRGGHCSSILYSLKAICDAKRGNPGGALASLRNADFLSSIGKKTWCAAQFMAKAWISQMIERRTIEGMLFKGYLTEPSDFYAKSSINLYRGIGAERRAKSIEKMFLM